MSATLNRKPSLVCEVPAASIGPACATCSMLRATTHSVHRAHLPGLPAQALIDVSNKQDVTTQHRLCVHSWDVW